MVEIYLSAPNEAQVLAFSVPSSDIQRLSNWPLKWLRFVTFTVCGVHGDLSATPDGRPVDYGNIPHADIAKAYYYTPEGDYNFVDYKALNDRITSSEQTARRSHFRAGVMDRDGSLCVFKRVPEYLCDAAHIIPRSKGDQYISQVLQDRQHMYAPISDLGINSVENGIFLGKELHAMFGNGDAAFLKTPNFALDTVDIPRVEADLIPPSRITLQQLVPPTGYAQLPDLDAHFAGTGVLLPPSILLDYMYGAAAYRRWGAGQDINGMMQNRFSAHYENIPMPPPSPASSASSNPGNVSDDSNCGKIKPSPRRRHHRSDMSTGMLQAMDSIHQLSMWLKGTTPEAMAAERQRREEEEELRVQKAGQVKVLEWLQSDVRSPSCHANSAPLEDEG